jgi:signal transduction histidine kinase
MPSRILLADGNAETRERTRGLLAAFHEVVQVTDGEAALIAIRQRKPDLVLAEARMPRVDGHTLVVRLRADPDTAALPIILLSSREGEESTEDAFEHMANDYLLRPFSAQELHARVNTHLDLARIRKAAEDGRQDMIRQLVMTQEEERHRMSRELHDTIGQHLTALQLGLKLLERTRPNSTVHDSTLARLVEVTATMARQVHGLAADLRPTALHDLGLVRTMQTYLEDWSVRADIGVDFHTEGLDGVWLPRHFETTVFRIVQDALSNVAKHSHAQHVDLILERRPDHFITMVEDNGLGFDVNGAASGPDHPPRGLARMNARASLLGGIVTVESSPQGGTTVFVRVPLTGQVRSHP